MEFANLCKSNLKNVLIMCYLRNHKRDLFPLFFSCSRIYFNLRNTCIDGEEKISVLKD